MKIAVVSANMGAFDPPPQHVEQSVPVDYHHFTDENYPRRSCAMTARLQARIPKMFAWSMCPGYDAYLWIDASMGLARRDSVTWFLEQMGGNDAAFFRHPDRKSVREEWDFIKAKVAEGNRYLTPRYAGEDGDGALAEIEDCRHYSDDTLLASTAFIYLNTDVTQEMLKEWWYGTSRYHSVDQLWLPFAIWKTDCRVSIIEQDYLHCDYLKRVRGHHGA